MKLPIVNKDEPRMNTNGQEDRWTSLAATPSWEESPPGSAGVPPAQHWHSLAPLSHMARPATAPGFHFGRAHAVPASRVAGRHIAGKLSGTQRQCMRAGRPRSRWAPPPSLLLLQGERAGLPGPELCRADHTRMKHPIVNQDEPRMNTKAYEPPWLRRSHGRKPPRERGRPARTTLAQPCPSPPPGSTGNGATILLRPSPCGSRQHGGRAPYRRETERYAT